ncbi:MAG: STM3941 family protein [Aureispira sp.]
MSTILVPYRKMYLLQQLANKLAVVLITAMFFLSMGSSWWTIIIVAIIVFLVRPKGHFIEAWKGNHPALLANEEGFIDYTRPYKLGIIAWEEVKAVDMYGFILKKQVRLTLHDPKRLLQQVKNPFNRWRMVLDIFLHQTPYYWDNRMLGITQPDFLKLLEELKNGSYDFNNFGQHLIEQ